MVELAYFIYIDNAFQLIRVSRMTLRIHMEQRGKVCRGDYIDKDMCMLILNSYLRR